MQAGGGGHHQHIRRGGIRVWCVYGIPLYEHAGGGKAQLSGCHLLGGHHVVEHAAAAVPAQVLEALAQGRAGVEAFQNQHGGISCRLFKLREHTGGALHLRLKICAQPQLGVHSAGGCRAHAGDAHSPTRAGAGELIAPQLGAGADRVGTREAHPRVLAGGERLQHGCVFFARLDGACLLQRGKEYPGLPQPVLCALLGEGACEGGALRGGAGQQNRARGFSRRGVALPGFRTRSRHGVYFASSPARAAAPICSRSSATRTPRRSAPGTSSSAVAEV